MIIIKHITQCLLVGSIKNKLKYYITFTQINGETPNHVFLSLCHLLNEEWLIEVAPRGKDSVSTIETGHWGEFICLIN